MSGTESYFKPSLIPVVQYIDALAMIEWLKEAFGLHEIFRVPGPDGTILHAELRWDSGVVMIGSKRDRSDGRAVFDGGPSWIYIVVDDPDAHHARARAAGAEIVEPPGKRPEGARGYKAVDPEGNQWSFSTRRPSLPDEASSPAERVSKGGTSPPAG